MIDPTRISAVRLVRDPVESPAPAHPEAAPRKARCGFAHGSDWGPGLTDEITVLLRTRLRLAGSIVLIAFTLYFLRNLVDPASIVLRGGAWGPLIHGGVIVALAGMAALLWSRSAWCTPRLRKIEL